MAQFVIGRLVQAIPTLLLALLIVFLCLLTGLIAALTLFLTLRSRSMETIRTREITMREGEPTKATASTNGHGQPERINALIEASPLAAVEWDSDLRLTRFSGQAERMFGIPASQAIGRKWSELGFVHPEDQNSVIQAINPLVSGQVDRIVVHNKNRRVTDGKTLHCVWYSSAVPSPDGQGRHFLSLAQDVTDQRAAEDAYRREADFVHRVAESAQLSERLPPLQHGSRKAHFVSVYQLAMCITHPNAVCGGGPLGGGHIAIVSSGTWARRGCSNMGCHADSRRSYPALVAWTDGRHATAGKGTTESCGFRQVPSRRLSEVVAGRICHRQFSSLRLRANIAIIRPPAA